MQSRLKFFLFLLLWGTSFEFLTAQEDSFVFQINQQVKFDLESNTQIYSDPTGSLSFEAIQKQTFSPLVNFTPSLDVNIYWVKLSVKSNLTFPSDWRLSLFREWCEAVEVFSKENLEDELWLIQRAGHLCPLKDLDENKNVENMARKMPNAISLSFQPNEEKIIYIRYRREFRDYFFPQLEFMPMVMAANQTIDVHRKGFYTITFMAMLVVLAFYHLLVFFMTRDIAYFYYALYGGAGAFAGSSMDEYGLLTYHLFYSTYPTIQPWVFILNGNTTISFYILFSRSFLNTKKRFPKLDMAMLVLFGIGILAGIIGSTNFIVTGRQYLPGMPFGGFIILIAFVFGILLTSVWKNKQPSDVFYLWGVGVMLVTLIPTHLIELINGYNPESNLNWTFPISPMQLGLVIELLLFSIGLGYRTRQVQLEKQRFQELDKVKSRFFANISHEFRTPLTLVMGPLQQIMKKIKDPKDQNLLQMAHRNANRLLELINQLLDLSKLEAGKMEMNAKQQNFAVLLRGIVMSFESLALRKNIRLHFVSQQENLPLYVDTNKMEKIFFNLLSNAFKFTKTGDVSVLITERGEKVEILVRDTGIGIATARLPYIFNRFYQVDSTEIREQEGTGIGLALVKELIQLHHGRIQVKSKETKGTTFIIHLLKGKKHFKEEEIVESVQLPSDEMNELISIKSTYQYESSPLAPIEATHNFIPPIKELKDLPIVLIIEDNEDVRYYIKQHLENAFQILEAVNGQDGIDKALEHLPDLVISDVMMPKKDGYEVCKTLKSDQRTSHIPIILLTAKAAQEEKLKGLETGADDYLIKPFDSKELAVRVRNLIGLRQQLRQRFSAAPSIEPQSLQTNAIDKAFLEKVCTTIQSEITNEQFSVEILAKTVGLSRVHLNRKLKALTDQSSNKFIQSFRLQKALILLQEKKGNVSEIAFKTGFSSTAYFVKCFREKYGKTPGSMLLNS